MTDTPTRHVDCERWLKNKVRKVTGSDVTITTAAPLVVGPYTTAGMQCPHGTTFWMEPTGEQIAKWAKEGTR